MYIPKLTPVLSNHMVSFLVYLSASASTRLAQGIEVFNGFSHLIFPSQVTVHPELPSLYR